MVVHQARGADPVRRSSARPTSPAPTRSPSSRRRGAGAEGGILGILSAGGLVFFTYVGFDAVSTAAAESRNPQRTIPIGLLATVAISTVLYVAVAPGAHRDGSVRKAQRRRPDLRGSRRRGPQPRLAEGGDQHRRRRRTGRDRDGHVLRPDAHLHAHVRGRDAPGRFGRYQRAHQARLSSQPSSAASSAPSIAGLVPLNVLAELVSIGTLLAFLLVCTGVLVLRRQRPDLERPFRVPHLHLSPARDRHRAGADGDAADRHLDTAGGLARRSGC